MPGRERRTRSNTAGASLRNVAASTTRIVPAPRFVGVASSASTSRIVPRAAGPYPKRP